MTAATETEYIEVHDPGREVVILTATDGETYTSKSLVQLKVYLPL